MNAERMTKEQAEAQGFTVDCHCYPWTAYKGPRFAPSEWQHVLTDEEARLAGMVSTALKLLDQAWIDDDDSIVLYDTQGVNQAHRVLAGGREPRETKLEESESVFCSSDDSEFCCLPWSLVPIPEKCPKCGRKPPF